MLLVLMPKRFRIVTLARWTETSQGLRFPNLELSPSSSTRIFPIQNQILHRKVNHGVQSDLGADSRQATWAYFGVNGIYEYTVETCALNLRAVEMQHTSVSPSWTAWKPQNISSGAALYDIPSKTCRKRIRRKTLPAISDSAIHECFALWRTFTWWFTLVKEKLDVIANMDISCQHV